jgi:hypothetical protein
MNQHRFPLIIVGAILITPRINLIEFGGSSVRLEDLLFALNAIWLATNYRRISVDFLPIKTILKAIIFISLLGIFSSVIASSLGRISLSVGILYSLRPLEYATILPTVLFLRKYAFNNLNRVLIALTLTTFVSVTLQSIFNLRFGTDRFSFSRSSGLTGGPYELAMISLMMCCHWISQRRRFLAAVSIFSILSSQSRITLLAFAVSALYLYSKRKQIQDKSALFLTKRKLSQQSALIVLIAAVASLSLMILNYEQVSKLANNYQDRVASTSASVGAFQNARELALSVTKISTSAEYSQWAFVSPPNFELVLDRFDASSARRYYIWNLVYETNIQNFGILFGMSPGFFGSAVDANFVRIFGELGTLGIFLYFFWLRRLWKYGNYIFKSVLITMLVTALYIDILVSIKSITLLYCLLVIHNAGNLVTKEQINQ